MKIFRRKLNRHTADNKGMTLVEMIVSFMLLSIFVLMSTIIISNIITLYYRVRGESYARQVSDIVMKKITSEISGAKYFDSEDLNPIINSDPQGTEEIDGSAITIIDSTDTKIRIYANDGIMKIHYYKIKDDTVAGGVNDRQAVTWTFDKKMYNGYSIKKLDFVHACELDEQKADYISETYGINADKNYPSDVVAVYMKLSSPKYGTFNIVRYVKLYNFPEEGYTISDGHSD